MFSKMNCLSFWKVLPANKKPLAGKGRLGAGSRKLQAILFDSNGVISFCLFFSGLLPPPPI